VNTDEVVVDPFESSDQDKAKKAIFSAEHLRNAGGPVHSLALEQSRLSDIYFTSECVVSGMGRDSRHACVAAIVAGCAAMTVFVLVGAGFCYHR
jgi:hypothetical protein